jgi:hypothetical protein
MNEYDNMREDHKPKTIDILFLAESPPPPWDGHRPFFYNDRDGMVPRDIFQSMMKALYPTEWRQVKEDFLTTFKTKSKFYLIDASKSPIEGSKSKRLSEIKKSGELIHAIRHLAGDGRFKGKQIRLIIIGARVHRKFYKYLLKNSPVDTPRGQYSIRILNESPLNFPRGNRATEEFIQKLRLLVVR